MLSDNIKSSEPIMITVNDSDDYCKVNKNIFNYTDIEHVIDKEVRKIENGFIQR